MRLARHALVITVLVAVLAVVIAVAVGCDSATPPSTVGEAVAPEPWDLTTPESAVRSYLDWVSFSYRMADSEIATPTMTAGESVRVDSYIQLNRIDGRGIEQFLDSLEITSVSPDASVATVTARESWRYRYFSLETLEYLSEEYTASYDTTYTLVTGPEGWLVDAVEAAPDAEVQ